MPPRETPYDVISKEYDDNYIKPFTLAARAVAIQAFYKAGYITEEEAKELLNNDWAERNECTTLIINEHANDITLSCCERTSQSSTKLFSMLFHLKYDRLTSVVTDELYKRS